MIKLKNLLRETAESDIERCLDKIRNKEYSFIAAGDNGKVYSINDEDKVFKITGDRDEYEVAEILVDRYAEFTTFIPIYYVDGKNMYIVANASDLPDGMRTEVDLFMQDFALFARDEGGEVSIFDFMRETDAVNPQLDNFLTALETDIQRLGVPEFELDFDFRAENIMMYNGHMVMVDW